MFGIKKRCRFPDTDFQIDFLSVWALPAAEPEKCLSADPAAGEGGGGAAQSHRHHLHLLQPGGSPGVSPPTETGGAFSLSLSLTFISLMRRNILVQEFK